MGNYLRKIVSVSAALAVQFSVLFLVAPPQPALATHAPIACPLDNLEVGNTYRGNGELGRGPDGKWPDGHVYRDPDGSPHQGVDVAYSKNGRTVGNGGRDVFAAMTGKVSLHNQAGGAGNWVKLNETGSGQTHSFAYFHNASFSVANRSDVAAGQKIAIGDNTGQSSGPHLHFETWSGSDRSGSYNNPGPYAFLKNCLDPQGTFHKATWPAPGPWTEKDHEARHGGGAVGTTVAACIDQKSICHSNGHLEIERDTSETFIVGSNVWESEPSANGGNYAMWGPYTTIPGADGGQYEACVTLKPIIRSIYGTENLPNAGVQVYWDVARDGGKVLASENKHIPLAEPYTGNGGYRNICQKFGSPPVGSSWNNVEVRLKVMNSNPAGEHYLVRIYGVAINFAPNPNQSNSAGNALTIPLLEPVWW